MRALRLGPLRVIARVTVPRSAGRQLPLPVLPGHQVPRRLSEAVLDSRLRGTKFVSLHARSILNPPSQTGMDFWSLNPYVGCEFGCTYCYARYAHRYVVERAHDAGKLTDAERCEFRGPGGWEAFETRVFVKEGLLGVLESDLRRCFRSGRATAHGSAPIVIGTATDPYQPAERRFRLTRAVLERLGGCEGLSVGLVTKSTLVTRDVDLLRRLQARNDVEVLISLIAVDAGLTRAYEARSPHPAARLRALRRLTRAGVHAGLIVAPVLPGISDSREQLDALFAAARDAGAWFVYAAPLRLYPALRARFLPVLDARRPDLTRRYRAAFSGRGAAPQRYAQALQRRVRALQHAYGFPLRHGMVDRYERKLPVLQGELGL